MSDQMTDAEYEAIQAECDWSPRRIAAEVRRLREEYIRKDIDVKDETPCCNQCGCSFSYPVSIGDKQRCSERPGCPEAIIIERWRYQAAQKLLGGE